MAFSGVCGAATRASIYPPISNRGVEIQQKIIANGQSTLIYKLSFGFSKVSTTSY